MQPAGQEIDGLLLGGVFSGNRKLQGMFRPLYAHCRARTPRPGCGVLHRETSPAEGQTQPLVGAGGGTEGPRLAATF